MDAYARYILMKEWVKVSHPYGSTVNNFLSGVKQRWEECLQRDIEYSAAIIGYVADFWSEPGNVGIEKHCEECDNAMKRTPNLVNKLRNAASIAVTTIIWMGLSLAVILPVTIPLVSALAKEELLEAPIKIRV